MKRNGAKLVIALMLIVAMMSAMLSAAAEDTGLELVTGEAARSGGLSRDGIESDLPMDGFPEVEFTIGAPEDAPHCQRQQARGL